MPQRILVGQVISHHCDKTAVVEVKRTQRHPLYHKNIVFTKKYMAHDSENKYQPGTWVRIRESRPLSKTKRWVVIGELNLSDQEGEAPYINPAYKKGSAA